MKLMNRLTKNNLKCNKKRTVVTIIGIILATSLLTAVATFVTSFQKSMILYEKENTGDWHYSFLQVPADELDKIRENRNVESFYEMVGLGYAKLEGGVNKEKPYLYVEAMDKNAFHNSSLTLKAGRLPQNEKELVISSHIKSNGGVSYEIGNTLTLKIGKRYSGGDVLNQQNPYLPEETWKETGTQTYTIVGVCERLSYSEENRTAPGYTVVTCLSDTLFQNSENFYDGVDIYTRFTKAGIKKQGKALSQILGIDPELLEKQQNNTYLFNDHKRLIQYETLSFDSGILSVIFKMSLVVMAIIVFTSAFCISNSFSISITEKMKQYGMLASVGATPRQILNNVYYEAFLLGTVSIPIGIICGSAACYILLKVVGALIGEALELTLTFSPSLLGILVAFVLSVVTIYFSARRPAKKAAKVSPIMAISGSGDVPLHPKKLKSPKVINKLFGIGGVLAYKNRKRNKRKYRVSVISIAASVTMFVALYGFMNLIFESAQFYNSTNYSLSIYFDEESGGDDMMEEVIKILENTERVNRFSVLNSCSFEIVGGAKLSSEYRYEEKYSNYINVYSIGNREYEKYTKKLGISLDDAKEGAILINNGLYYDEESNKNIFFKIFDYHVGDVIEVKEVGEKMESSSGNESQRQIKVTGITQERPFGLEKNYYSNGCFIVCDEWLEKNIPNTTSDVRQIFIDCENADELQELFVEQLHISNSVIHNVEQQKREEQSLYLVIEIFLYGFMTVISLIGITNIFNTITTSMELRSMEFAMLSSIGMTKREFNRMIGLESVFYGGFALVTGLLAGNALCYIFYKMLAKELSLKFQPPIGGMLLASAAVILLLFGIMKYSIARIRKQNIIETIRQENI